MKTSLRQLTASLALALASPLLAQTLPQPTWQQAAGSQRHFEVATFKPVLPNAPRAGNIDLTAADSSRYNGGLVRMDGLLIEYVIFAYKLNDESQYQSIYKQLGKPAETQRYVLEARPEGHPTTDELRLMVQSLLAERVRLALHTEIRQGRVYLLTRGHQAAGLVPHPNDGICTPQPANPVPHAEPATLPYCALLLTRLPNHLLEARVLGYSMDRIAGSIASLGASRGGMDALPVLNRTGLSGNFDHKFTFLPATTHALAEGESEEPGAGFPDALRTDAGLRLTKATGPVDTVIIDHVELPTAD